MLSRLNWDMSSVLATDYLDHILNILPKNLFFGHENDSFPICSCPDITNNDCVHHNYNLHHYYQSGPVLSQSNTAIVYPNTKRQLESSCSHMCPARSKRFRSDHQNQDSLNFNNNCLQHTIRRHASILISLCSTGKFDFIFLI